MRQKEGPSTTFQGPAAMCRTRTSHVYVFASGGAGSEDSSEEEEQVAASSGRALRPRGKERGKTAAPGPGVADTVLMQRPVAQEDSLYKLAVQYGCQVADIKKVNSLVREQDLHGLRCVRIPVQSHGVLTEPGHGLTPVPSAASETRVTFEEHPELGAQAPGAPSPLTRFFRDIDQSIARAAQAETLLDAAPGPDPTTWPLPPTPARALPPSAHGGVRWWKALVLLLLVGVVLPLCYLVYFKIQAASESPGGWNGTAAAHTGPGAQTAVPQPGCSSGPSLWPEK